MLRSSSYFGPPFLLSKDSFLTKDRLDRRAALDDVYGAPLWIGQAETWVDTEGTVNGGGKVFGRRRVVNRILGMFVRLAIEGTASNSGSGDP